MIELEAWKQYSKKYNEYYRLTNLEQLRKYKREWMRRWRQKKKELRGEVVRVKKERVRYTKRPAGLCHNCGIIISEQPDHRCSEGITFTK